MAVYSAFRVAFLLLALTPLVLVSGQNSSSPYSRSSPSGGKPRPFYVPPNSKPKASPTPKSPYQQPPPSQSGQTGPYRPADNAYPQDKYPSPQGNSGQTGPYRPADNAYPQDKYPSPQGNSGQTGPYRPADNAYPQDKYPSPQGNSGQTGPYRPADNAYPQDKYPSPQDPYQQPYPSYSDQTGPYGPADNYYAQDQIPGERYNKQIYGAVPPYVKEESEVDEVDRLFATIDTLSTELDLAIDNFGNAEAQEAVNKEHLTQLTLIDLPGLESQNKRQNKRLDTLEEQMEALEAAIKELTETFERLNILNTQNAANVTSLEAALATEDLTDVNQGGAIASLLAAARNLQPKLLTILRNKFADLENAIQKVAQQLQGNVIIESSRTCQTGVSTLSSDDRRVVINFQADFGGKTPQVLYGISGFKVKFVGEPGPARPYTQYDHPPYPSYPSYDGGPSTTGAIINFFATPSSVTFELVDPSFNDGQLQTADVSWQACSIGPGAVLASY